jgi:hypothetical protein
MTMLLYDVYYRGVAMDSHCALPRATSDMTCAQNTNWDQELLVPTRPGMTPAEGTAGNLGWSRAPKGASVTDLRAAANAKR